MQWRWWRNRATAGNIFTRENHTERIGAKAAVATGNGATIGIPTTLTKWIETNPPPRTVLPSNRYGRYDASYVAHGGNAVLTRFLNPQRHRFVSAT